MIDRRTGIGGSEVAAVLGLNPHTSPIDIWLRKTGCATEIEDNDQMRWGRLLEPVIADEYARIHGVELVGPLATNRHPDRPWQVYSIDRVVCDALDEIEDLGEILRIVEIKARGWRREADYGPDDSDEVPTPEKLQVHWYMSAVDAPEAHIAVLFDTSRLRFFRVDRNERLEADLLERVERWWRDHVIGGVEPPPDGSDSFRRHLHTKYSMTTGELRLPSKEERAIIEGLREAKRKRALFEGEESRLIQHVLLLAGDSDGFDLGPDGKVYTRLQRGRVHESQVVESLARSAGIPDDELQAIRDRHRGHAIRTLRIVEKKEKR